MENNKQEITMNINVCRALRNIGMVTAAFVIGFGFCDLTSVPNKGNAQDERARELDAMIESVYPIARAEYRVYAEMGAALGERRVAFDPFAAYMATVYALDGLALNRWRFDAREGVTVTVSTNQKEVVCAAADKMQQKGWFGRGRWSCASQSGNKDCPSEFEIKADFDWSGVGESGVSYAKDWVSTMLNEPQVEPNGLSECQILRSLGSFFEARKIFAKSFKVGCRKVTSIGANCVFVSFDVVVPIEVGDWEHLPLQGLKAFPLPQVAIRSIDARRTGNGRVKANLVFDVRGIERRESGSKRE